MAALYYHPAGGKASRVAVAPSLRSLALRPSQSKVLCISSSRWWLRRRRWEGKASGISISSRPVARPALFSPVAMEWQECTYVSFLQIPRIPCQFLGVGTRFTNLNLFLRLWGLKIDATFCFPKEGKQDSVVVFLNLDSPTELEVDVPCSVAYQCYSERESIPQWMPFISSVKILEDKPDLSRWSLKYEVLGRNVEFSWLARNMTPIKNQKIHWRSLEGLPNRGAVRFFPKGPSSCRVQLTVAYELPEILAPVGSALKPFLEGLLLKGLESFAAYAKERNSKIPQP